MRNHKKVRARAAGHGVEQRGVVGGRVFLHIGDIGKYFVAAAQRREHVAHGAAVYRAPQHHRPRAGAAEQAAKRGKHADTGDNKKDKEPGDNNLKVGHLHTLL